MLNIDKTPQLPAASSNRENPIHREVHQVGPERTYNEEKITETREVIVAKYGITPEHIVLDLQPEEGEQRIIRAFSIIKHLTDPQKIYYAEGHRTHFELFEKIIENFKEEMGIDSIKNLDLDVWAVKKGFIDPNNNHFKSFPNARAGLISLYQQNENINGGVMIDDQLPNWFLSADSEEKLTKN